jgi:hypothetical protein
MRFVLLLMAISVAFAEEAHEENRRRADAELADNTRQLHEAFRARDATREAYLYTQRREILVRRRDLRPPSNKPAVIHRGFVEGFPAARLSLRRVDGFHDQLWIGPVYKREAREAYLALKVGDEVELVFTEQPDPLSDERYLPELTAVRQIGPGEGLVESVAIVKNFLTQGTLLRVAGKRFDGTQTYLAVIRNTSRGELRFGEDGGIKVRVTNSHDVDEKITASISPSRNLSPGEVLSLQIEVAPLPSRVVFIGIQVSAPDNSSIVSAHFPLERTAD